MGSTWNDDLGLDVTNSNFGRALIMIIIKQVGTPCQIVSAEICYPMAQFQPQDLEDRKRGRVGELI